MIKKQKEKKKSSIYIYIYIYIMNTVPFISFTSKAEEVDSLPFFVCAFGVFFFIYIKAENFLIFLSFHKTSFVDILQMIPSNNVPILSSCEDSLYTFLTSVIFVISGRFFRGT